MNKLYLHNTQGSAFSHEVLTSFQVRGILDSWESDLTERNSLFYAEEYENSCAVALYGKSDLWTYI